MKISRRRVNKIIFFILIFVFLPIIGCWEEPKETAIKGYLSAYADESVFPLTSEIRNEFVRLYEKSKIDLKSVTAREGIAKIINNETRLFVSSRNFNEEEMNIIKKYNLEIKSFKFIYDGIAVITRKSGKKDSILADDLKDLLLNKKNDYKIVMPFKNSGIYDFIKNDFLKGNDPVGVEFVNSEEDVIKIIKNTPGKLGLVGINLLNDSSDVKIVPVGKMSPVTLTVEYYDLHPAYLYQQVYPLTRTIYVFLREPYIGIGSGFATFMVSNEGQKIALSKNLAPAAVPVKLRQTY